MADPVPVAVLLAKLAGFATAVNVALGFNQGVDWQWRPAAGEWSLTEVVCHLRDVEREVHQPRFRALLEQENPFLPGVSSDAWAVERGYAAQDGETAVAEFLQARQETVQLLTGLDESDWQRSGRHSFLGPTTLQELVTIVVRHDEVHWGQIEGLLRKGRGG